MSLSERISNPRVGQSWHVPSTKSKNVKFAGELAIFFGLIFVGFGVFGANGAGASEIEPSAVAQAPSPEMLMPMVPSRSDLDPRVAVLSADLEKAIAAPVLQERPSIEKIIDPTNNLSVAKESFDLQTRSELAEAESDDEEVTFEGARVKAGFVLPVTKIDWFEEPFIISHYTYALESDPMYADDKRVSVPGLPSFVKLREGFIFGGRGVIQQGTGLTEDGRYISIDWTKSVYDENDVSNNRWFFKFGAGRPVTEWETVAVQHPDLPPGTRIFIENYGETYDFVVGDAGLDLAVNQIDIFVGPMTIAEADELGVQKSRVGIVRPISYYAPQGAPEPTEAKE